MSVLFRHLLLSKKQSWPKTQSCPQGTYWVSGRNHPAAFPCSYIIEWHPPMRMLHGCKGEQEWLLSCSYPILCDTGSSVLDFFVHPCLRFFPFLTSWRGHIAPSHDYERILVRRQSFNWAVRTKCVYQHCFHLNVSWCPRSVMQGLWMQSKVSNLLCARIGYKSSLKFCRPHDRFKTCTGYKEYYKLLVALSARRKRVSGFHHMQFYLRWILLIMVRRPRLQILVVPHSSGVIEMIMSLLRR